MKQEKVYRIYIPRYHKQSKFYQIFKNHFETFVCSYYAMKDIYQNYGDLSNYQIDTVHKFLKCQDLTEGFRLATCPQCGTSYIIPFSYKKHKICPSCRMKRLIEFSEWLKQEVLLNLKHRHIVLTIFMRTD